MFNKEMLDKLQGLKNQADESKSRLENMRIEEDAGGGLIRIAMNGNRKLESIEVNADLNTIDKEDLEDLLTVAFSRALDKVNEINEKEVMSSAQSLFPGV
ncbi:MAG: YbaB/EbfC family nucleoid-associated protein [Crocinitomicaceae bacterium]|nr:YbaB/EbfC family nucleoid-associated protein [Crocinitomicaceae bacterium]